MNRAVFDCVSRYFADDHVSRIAILEKQDVVAAFNDLCLEAKFKDSIEKTPKTIEATTYRISRWGKVLSDVLSMEFHPENYRIL